MERHFHDARLMRIGDSTNEVMRYAITKDLGLEPATPPYRSETKTPPTTAGFCIFWRRRAFMGSEPRGQ